MDDFERRKYFAARRVWPMRDEPTPKVEAGEKVPYTDWSGWFERMFGEPLDAYVERAQAENLRERVRR